ncbi:hypothetical protein [Pontixanthobacter luteolus]|uniref:hypothetical protein n=1 Tax=Pontixanthobacter luteolus TaxID=295089 RepID=UPI001371883D|nr:hypothetical protein [Pontixanthobacter luteolus]
MNSDQLPLSQSLALAHAGTRVRQVLAPFFELDRRLSQFVSQAKEPMLAQMRIAWWRDQLGKKAEDRPAGDPVLAQLTAHWAGEEVALQCLADGWEALLAEPPLPSSAANDFATGRAACFAAVARLSGNQDHASKAYSAGQRWALADLAARVSDGDERAFVLEQAEGAGRAPSRMPFALRSIAILDRLAIRSLAQGGSELIRGRSEILLITRLGLFGR